MFDYIQIKNAVSDKLTTNKWLNVYSPFGNKIAKNIYYKDDLDSYLSNLQRQGNYPYLLLKLYRSNGTGVVKLGELKKNFLTANQPMQPVQHTETNYQPAQTKPMQPQHQPQNMFGLNMPMPAGLNGMDIAYRVQQFPEVKSERDKLKESLESCKEKLRDAELKIKLFEFEKGKKGFWESPAFEKALEVLPDLTEKFKQDANQAAGLNAPQLAPEVQNLVNKVSQFDKQTAVFINSVVDLIYQSQPFIDELTVLIEKYKNESATN